MRGAPGLRLRGRQAKGRFQERLQQRLLAVGERLQEPCWRLQSGWRGADRLWRHSKYNTSNYACARYENCKVHGMILRSMQCPTSCEKKGSHESVVLCLAPVQHYLPLKSIDNLGICHPTLDRPFGKSADMGPDRSQKFDEWNPQSSRS